jgi:acetyl-CoA C-acetyltransferase
MQNNDPIVIVGYARTPLGAFQGVLAPLTSPQLGSSAIRGALNNANIQTDQIQEVIMGCVLPAGLGQAPARQAALGAKLENSTACSTINKVCGSGMKAVMLAHDALLADTVNKQMMIAGGMESMTNAPYLLAKARGGLRMGHGSIHDHMFVDGLEDAYDRGKLMGIFADETAARLKISRSQQDEFTLRSLELAQQAIKNNYFTQEITPVAIESKTETITISTDECPSKAKPEKIPTLKPAFSPDGTVTAANSSSISDGAAALVLMRLSTAQQNGLTPIAKILGQAQHSQEPHLFTTAPVQAITKLLAKTNIQLSQIDLFEINEAFAVVTLAAIQELKLDINKVNVHGGACALGHPIGASGARILCTLLSGLRNANKKIGVAAICIGGGEATAMAVELL